MKEGIKESLIKQISFYQKLPIESNKLRKERF